jgi:hypothetical protein
VKTNKYTQNQYTNDIEPYEDTSDDTNSNSEGINDVQSTEGANNNIQAEDFNPERVLYDIRKALLGFDKRDGNWVRVSEPLARTEFITLYINSIRSLVNFHNLFSQISAEESAFNMLEGLKEITFASVDYGIEEEHIETFINIYDRLMQTFYGIIIDGRGTENVKQVLISAYKDITALRDGNVNQTGLINFDKLKEYMKN